MLRNNFSVVIETTARWSRHELKTNNEKQVAGFTNEIPFIADVPSVISFPSNTKRAKKMVSGRKVGWEEKFALREVSLLWDRHMLQPRRGGAASPTSPARLQQGNVLSSREQSQTRNPSSLLQRRPCCGGKKENNFILLCHGFASISRNESYPHFNVCMALGTALCINNFCFNKRKHLPGQQQIQGSKRINECWASWRVLCTHPSTACPRALWHSTGNYTLPNINDHSLPFLHSESAGMYTVYYNTYPPLSLHPHWRFIDMLGMFIPKIYKGNEHC